MIHTDASQWTVPLREHERLALAVRQHLPTAIEQRTQDVIEFHYGGEHGIALLLTPEAVEVRLPTVDWTRGTHDPVASTRLWRRLKLAQLGGEEGNWPELWPAVDRALAVRTNEFRPCRYCKQLTPVEHRTGRACHGCASTHEGIVY